MGFSLGLVAGNIGPAGRCDKPLTGSLPPLDAPDPRRPGGFRQHGPLFISPMGEPFHGDDPIGRWFAGVDTQP